MPRGRKKTQQTNTLLEAVRFVNVAQQLPGTVQQTHCMMQGRWIAASDGIVTAAAAIEDDLATCPQTARLLAALERSPDTIAITQEPGKLSIKSGGFRAIVPCVEPSELAIMGPNDNVAALTPSFLDALKAIQHIASDTGERVHLISFLVQGPSVSATNGAVLAEYWHGNDLPPYFVLPKNAVNALLRCGKVPTGFGYDGRSCTFYFEGGWWLKTQLYEDKWPNIGAVFEKEVAGYSWPVPATLFEALKLVGDFSDCNRVKFEAGTLKTQSREPNAQNAEYDVKGLIEGPAFSVAHLSLLAPIAKTCSYRKGDASMFFKGENLRGAISVFQSDPT